MEEKNILQNEEPQGEQFGETIHIYPVQGGGMYWILESQLPEEEKAKLTSDPVVLSEEEPKPQVHQVAPAAPRRGVRLPCIVWLTNVAIILAVFLFTSLQTVTITITPKSQQITAHLTLDTIESRVFSPLTLTQRKTVQTTGHGHQDATNASGFVTFYNALPQEQTIAAGTLLTAANGDQFLTDADVTIPAGTYSTNGQAIAHITAQNAGTEGNLAAGEIQGLCCRAGILVFNQTLTGGQNARDYQIVTKADIQSVIASLLPTLVQTMTTSLEKQVQVTETLLQPKCSQTISTNHQAGDEAQTVTVTVKKQCLAGAYTTNGVQAAIVQALSQKEPGYQPTAYLQTSPFQSSLHNGQVILAATYQATMRYHFSQAQTNALVREIQGKQRRQALQLLSSFPGVAHIAITTPTNREILPTDTEYIHLVIVS